MSATYTKLRSGEWGIRSTEPISEGQAVLVAKRSGETKRETVGRVIWSGNGVVLCSISRGSARRADGASWYASGCSACRDLGHMCPDCEFDEFDC